MEIWVDIETTAGVKIGDGPIATATQWTHTPKLDGAGTFSFTMPASDERSLYLVSKRIARGYTIINSVLTVIGAGIIDSIEMSIGDPSMITVTGPDLMGELATRTVGQLIICEQAWTDLSVATEGMLGWFRVDANTWTDPTIQIPNAHDGNDATFESIYLKSDTSGNPEHASYLYVGYDARFDRIRILFEGADYANNAYPLKAQYFTEANGWVDLAIVADGTNDGAGTFRKNGDITFTRPTDWARYEAAYGGGNWFWVRLKVERVFPADPSYTDYFHLAEVDVYADVPTTNGVNLIMALAPATWTLAGYPATTSAKYLEFDGQSVLEALVTLAEQGGVSGGGAAIREHFRLGVGRAIDWMGTTITSSGVRAIVPEDAAEADGKAELCLIRSLSRQHDSAEVVTRVYPRTAENLTIALTTRAASAGYTHDVTLNYIQHTAGHALFGLIERQITFDAISMQQADSLTTHPAMVANQLHDAATEWLRVHATANYYYQLSIGQFPEVIQVGDTIDAVYHEYIAGVHTIDIDTIQAATPLYVLSATFSVDSDGMGTIGMEVSTIDRARLTDADIVAGLVGARNRSASQASNITIQAQTSSSAATELVGSAVITSGAIAGFIIGSDYIRDAANIFGLASTVTAGDDVRLWAGVTFANRATAPFAVFESGLINLGGYTYTWPAAGAVTGEVLQATVAATAITVAWVDPATFTHAILSATHSDTLADNVLDGDIIIGNVTPKWSRLVITVPAANVRNVLGVDNGELRPSWKTALDATNPTTLTVATAAAPGTSLVFAHRDHAHAITTSSNPGSAAAILASTAAGLLNVENLTLGNGSGGTIDLNSAASASLIKYAATNLDIQCRTDAAGAVRIIGSAAHAANFEIWNASTALKKFSVAGATGNLWLATAATTTFAGVAYTWPAADAAGYLTSNGAGALTWAVGAGVADHTLLNGGAHTDTTASLPSVGDLIVGVDMGGGVLGWDDLAISVPAANILNFLGVANGETAPAWKSASSHPGAAVAILASDASGYLTLTKLVADVAGVDATGTSYFRSDVKLYSAADLYLYSDGGVTQKLLIDGATGNITSGDGATGGTLTLWGAANTAKITYSSNNLDIQAYSDAVGVVRVIGTASWSPRFEVWNTATALKKFMVSGDTGNLWLATAATTTFAGIAYTWPAADAAGYLTSNGAGGLTWAAGAGVADHTLLNGGAHTDTTASAAVLGAVIIGNATPAWTRYNLIVPAANIRNVLGVDNGGTTPIWKEALDGTNAETLTVATVAAPGTSLIFSHRDHAHAITTSSNPGANARILASTAAGLLTVENLTLGNASGGTLDLYSLGNAALIKYTANTLNIQCRADSIGVVAIIGTATQSPRLEVWNAAAALKKFEVAGATGNLWLATAATTTFGGIAYTWPAADAHGYLHSDGAGALTWGTTALPTAHPIMDSTYHSDVLTHAPTVTDGDLMVGNVTPKWDILHITVPAANVRNVLGIDNGELRPSWKTALDATNTATLTVSSTSAAGTSLVFAHRDHSHAITSSSNPGAWARILASDASGYLQLTGLGIGAAAGAANRITMADGGQIGQPAGPLVSFDDTHNYLEIIGANVGIKTTAPDRALEINDSGGSCLRLTYNDADGSAASYTDFYLTPAGGLTLESTGGMLIQANAAAISITSLLASTGAIQFYDDSGLITLLNLDNVNNRCGINTTGPGRALEVNDALGACLRLTYNDFNGAAVNFADFTVSNAGALLIESVSSATLKSAASTVTLRAGVASTTAIQLLGNTGTLIMGVDSTNDRVGIGTSAPDRTLSVNSAGTCTLRLSHDAAAGGAVTYTDISMTHSVFGVESTGSVAIQANTAAITILSLLASTSCIQLLNNASVSVLAVDGVNSRIGINTTAPDRALEVNSATGSCLRLTYNDSTGGAANFADLTVSNAGALLIEAVSSATLKSAASTVTLRAGVASTTAIQFQGNTGTVIMSADSTNNRVGIGTSAPDMALEINHATGQCLRLTYNDSNGSAVNYADFIVGATGQLRISSVEDLTIRSANTNIYLEPGAAGNVYIEPIGGPSTVTIDVAAGSLWLLGDCSALTFTDRTAWWDAAALPLILQMGGKGGKIDHDRLPDFARSKTKDDKGRPLGRDLGGTVSLLVKAVQELSAKVEALEAA